MPFQRIEGSGCFKNKRFNKPSALNCYQRMRSPMVQANKRRKVQAGANCLTVENNTGFEESCSASARTPKRASQLWSSDFEIYEGNADKKRVIEKQNEGLHVVSRYPSPFLKKGHSWRHANVASKDLKMMLRTWGSPSFFWHEFGPIFVLCWNLVLCTR